MSANCKATDSGILNRKAFLKENQTQSVFRQTVQMFFEHRTAVAGLIVFMIIFLLTIFADVLADYDTVVIGIDPRNRLLPPSMEHLFGTDELGRDVFARVIHGARISLKIGSLSIMLAATIGCTLGAVAGYYGGFVDTLIMRFTDIFVCLPSMMLAIAIVAAFGNTQTNLILAIGLSRSVHFTRIVRSAVLSVSGIDYVEAARTIGARDSDIIFKHILINCLGPIIVQVTVGLAGAITSISGLSFIGLGISAPAPEWGNMLASARAYMRDHANLVLAPGLSIFATTLSLNLMGDGLRDALDPKLRK